MKVAPLRRQPLPAPRARTRTHAHSAHFWKALYICAHAHSYIYLHCYTHRYVPSETHLVLARSHSRRRPPRVGASDGRARRRGTHRSFRLGQSTAAGSAASSVLDASLRAKVRPPEWVRPIPARACSARHDRPRRVRPRPAPRVAAQRPAQDAARGAQQRNAGTATNARKAAGGRAGRTGSPRACTGRATPGAPSPSWRRCTCRCVCIVIH
jgi:hypothetical protein